MKLRRHVGSIVAVVLAVVVGVLMVLDDGKVSDRERKDREHDVFPAYRRSDIDWLEIAQGSTKLRIERRPDHGDVGETHWQMTAPVDERADPAAVDRFVGDLEFAGVIRRVDPGKAPEVNQGFESPRVRGTLSMKPLVYHFLLGGPAPVPEGAAYLRVEGEGTFVVSKDFVASLTNGPDTYRERSVVPYLSLDLAGLEIKSGDGTLGVTRVDDISFKLAGSGLRASRDGMDKVWGALAEARAESFLTEAEAEGAIGASPVHVTMTPKDSAKPKGEIALGGACPGHPQDIVFMRLAPTRESACVPKGAKDGLLTPEAALVDHHLFAARADEVEEITLETIPAGFTVELARKGRGWHERKPTDRELSGPETDVMNELVTKLTRGEATTVDTGDGTGLSPRARVHVKRGGSGVEEVVDLEAGTELVHRAFDGAMLHVPSALGRRLWPSEIALRGRSVFADRMEGRSPSALRTRCDGVRQSLVYDKGQWTFVEPHGYAADPLATADLVALVKNAQAASWVADKDDGSFGFGASACSMELDAAGEAEKTTLGIVFGKEAEPGMFYARATNGDAVFLASNSLREGATGWLIDRGAFRAEPRTVERVTLSGGSLHVVLAGRPTNDDAGVNDTTSKVLEALEVLRPDLVIHVGPSRPDEGFANPTLDVRIRVALDAGRREIHFVLGDTVISSHVRIVYARVDGVDATFGIARERVLALIEAL